MKNKFTKILGVVLTLAVLASMLVVSTPASAGYNAWSASTGPDSVLSTTDIVSGIDVTDMAVASNGLTGYAIATDSLVYKTIDGGKTWAATKYAAANGTPVAVAVAPDVADGSFVIVATATGAFVSGDGGNLFSAMTGFSASAITDIDVSPVIGTSRGVVIAADNEVWYFASSSSFGGGTAWQDLAATYTSNVTVGATLAAKFSPNYLQDRTLVVVTSTSSNTTVMQLFNTATSKWNADYTVYGVPNGGTVIHATAAAATADLELPGSYMALDVTLRTAYIATDLGLYRNATQLTNIGMKSVAVNTAGDKLVAGQIAGNTIWRLASPATALGTAMIPSGVYKSPSVPATGLVSVEFFGTSVGAATVGGAESAFALSTSDGAAFNDVAFIDTVLTPSDFVVNADGSKMYMVTENAGVASLWSKTTSWERVFKVTSGAGYIIRPALSSFDVIYFVDDGTANIMYSNDAGQTTWQPRVAFAAIDDFAAESASVLYALSSGAVWKATDGGYLWTPAGGITNVGTGGALTLLSAGNLLIAGSTGVAYSTDSAATFTTVGGNFCKAVADKLTAGGVITAYIGTAISQYTIGTSVAFKAITTASAITGTAVDSMVINSGVIYALTNNETLRSPISNFPFWSVTVDTVAHSNLQGSSAGLFSLVGGSVYAFVDVFAAAGPAAAAPADNFIVPMNQETGNANNVVFQWTAITNSPIGTTYKLQIALDSTFTQVVKDIAGIGGVLAIVGPTGSTGMEFAWQSDTTYYWRVRTGAAYDSPWSTVRKIKIDTLSPVKLVSPVNGAMDIALTPTFAWSTAAGATGYELVVSDDPTFAIITYSRTSTNAVFYSDEELAYSTVYYWKVRPTGTAYPAAGTPYVMGIFTTMAKPTETQAPITITQTTQTITVDVPAPQETIPSYLLWIIIAIGAILVIALIVLIVRTRRVS